MADAIFEYPRLAGIYDAFDGDRLDLDAYEKLVDDLGAHAVLDIGCGTGNLACRLAARGIRVTGIDPAEASLAVAQTKPWSDRVTWMHGTVPDLPAMEVDLAVMTGNVAQVFITDEEWRETLRAVRKALRPGGRLVFETRKPEAQAWLAWNREGSYQRITLPDVGVVEGWTDVTEVRLPFVSFQTTYLFQSDGAVITSDSTLRFRSREEIKESLRDVGMQLDEVREAPDRLGLEFVVVARRPTT